jgi:hypothetical protein
MESKSRDVFLNRSEPESRNALLSKDQLQARGWTRSSITRFLGTPDRIQRKSGYACIEHLYRRDRVEDFEARYCIDGSPVVDAYRQRRSRKHVKWVGLSLLRCLEKVSPNLSRRDLGILKMVFSGSAERTVASRYGVSRQLIGHIKCRAILSLQNAGATIPIHLLRWRESTKSL